MKKYHVLFAITLLVVNINAQMSGVYNIPSNLPSLAVAISSLNSVGVSGPVTLNLSAGYTETVPLGGLTLLPIMGASATNSLVIQKSGSGLNPLLIAYSGGTATAGSTMPDAICRFVGTDYMIIDGVDLFDPNATNPATMEYGYVFYRANGGNGCQYNTIQNCRIVLNRVNFAGVTNTDIGPAFHGSKGISFVNIAYSNPTSLVTATATSGSHSYNKVYSNRIENCHFGILFGGWALSNPAFFDTNNDIGGLSAVTGNTIINYGGGGTTSSAAIHTYANHHINESFNYIDNNNGTSIDHPYTLRGIVNWFTAHNANVTINSNTISVKGVGTSQKVTAIENVDNSTSATSSNTVTIKYNVVNNCTSNNGGSLYSYWLSGYSGNIVVDGNSALNLSCLNEIGGMYFNGAKIISVTSNTISNLTSGTYIMGVNCPNSSSLTLTNNLFENLKATSWLEGFMPGTSVVSFNATGNTLRNFSVKNNGYLYGIHEIGTNANKVIANNTIHTFSISPPGTGGANMAAIYCTQGTVSINGNTIYNLSSSGSNGTVNVNVYGILVTGGQFASIQKNKIYGLTCTSQKGYVCGISNSISSLISNNTIGNFSCTSCISPTTIAGVELNNGNNSFYYNSVYLKAPSTVSLSGTTALFASTIATLDARNNILVNVSTSTAIAVTSAFRRNGNVLANYAAASNNNLYYAGIPSNTNVIFTDGSISYSSLTAYKTAVWPRDSASVTELAPFTSTAGASSNFLDINPLVQTKVESGALPIVGINDDYPGTIRNSSTPDIGAWEGNFIPNDLTSPVDTTLGFIGPPCNLTSRTLTVAISDPAGVATGTFSPRCYFKVNSAPSYASTQGTLMSGNVFNGIWSFNLNYSCLSGDIISYYVVSQDSAAAPNISSNPLSGFSAHNVNVITSPPISPHTYTVYYSSLPVISNPAVLCAGSTGSLSASGATSYTWNPGGLTGSNVAVTPTSTTIYTLNATLGVCSFSNIATMSVVPNPTVYATSNYSLICVGQAATLTASGANNYTWTPGGTGASIVITPTITTTYTLTGSDLNNCENTSLLTQSVSACTNVGQSRIVESKIKVYPNPVQENLFIENLFEYNLTVEIYDATGKQILNKIINNGKLTISMGAFSRGIYYIRIILGGTELFAKKIIKG